MPDDLEPTYPPVTSLTKVQRRVLGVLIEKGFTTPDQYPLTLKAATSACNQKNNRDPLTSYDEPQVEQAMDELRELGLAAVVHTESGRTERYRHWMRKRFADMSEGQLAILGELLLRGRQQVGELRARASRMSAIDSLDQLRRELDGLRAMTFVQNDGPLDRRGAEVDHNWYEPREGMALAVRPPDPIAEAPRPTVTPAAPVASHSAQGDWPRRVETLETTCANLRSGQQELQSELARLRESLDRMATEMDSLRRDLGG